MKKSIAILLILVAALAVVSCARVDAASQVQEAKTETVQQEIEEVQPVAEKTLDQEAERAIAAPEPEADTTANEPEVAAEPEKVDCVVEADGYKAEVVGATISQDYNGTDIIMISVLFTNNNPAPTPYWQAVKDSAKQNGMSLTDDMPLDYSILSTSAQPVSNGQTVLVYLPYELKDAGSKVDFTISIFNFERQTALVTDSCSLTLS